MKCPNCSTPLVMSDRQGIEIDYCPDCRGVWLDRGELDKLIDRTTSSIGGDRRGDDRFERNIKHSYPVKKKKMSSMLGDIFDF